LSVPVIHVIRKNFVTMPKANKFKERAPIYLCNQCRSHGAY
jgi:hypothetical protein